ncbi:hypothetical protein L596_005413 [Steinernema carpocapsae]|uniref:Uncharacterized protein n=1 Tax=Steinernema carpocapsae TaxID=34508 RepID=A0A4U8V042_STECR|nr:hypothetical protein L596_005413 [Steinernema carpocapsae]
MDFNSNFTPVTSCISSCARDFVNSVDQVKCTNEEQPWKKEESEHVSCAFLTSHNTLRCIGEGGERCPCQEKERLYRDHNPGLAECGVSKERLAPQKSTFCLRKTEAMEKHFNERKELFLNSSSLRTTVAGGRE